MLQQIRTAVVIYSEDYTATQHSTVVAEWGNIMSDLYGRDSCGPFNSAARECVCVLESNAWSVFTVLIIIYSFPDPSTGLPPIIIRPTLKRKPPPPLIGKRLKCLRGVGKRNNRRWGQIFPSFSVFFPLPVRSHGVVAGCWQLLCSTVHVWALVCCQ